MVQCARSHGEKSRRVSEKRDSAPPVERGFLFGHVVPFYRVFGRFCSQVVPNCRSTSRSLETSVKLNIALLLLGISGIIACVTQQVSRVDCGCEICRTICLMQDCSLICSR